MDVEVPIQRAFPRNTILTAICNIGCNQATHGVITQDAHIKKHAFLIGVHGKGREVDLTRRDALVSMDSEFDSIDCVVQERWRKLIFNSAWNSTTALTGLNTHQLLEHPSAVLIVAQLAREAFDVAIASGIELDSDLPNKTIELARMAPAITPSTLQDARSKRPMELTPIFGYICQQAARVGASVPTVRPAEMLTSLTITNTATDDMDVRPPTTTEQHPHPSATNPRTFMACACIDGRSPRQRCRSRTRSPQPSRRFRHCITLMYRVIPTHYSPLATLLIHSFAMVRRPQKTSLQLQSRQL